MNAGSIASELRCRTTVLGDLAEMEFSGELDEIYTGKENELLLWLGLGSGRQGEVGGWLRTEYRPEPNI